MKTRKLTAMLLTLAMVMSLCSIGAAAVGYEPVSIAEGEPVTIQWTGSNGTVVSVDGSGYIPAEFILWVENSDTIMVDGVSQKFSYTSADGANFAFEVATKAAEMTITAVSGGVTYTITCPPKSAAPESNPTPTALNGYLPIGQYANGKLWGSPYSDDIATLGKTPKVVGGYSGTGVSLGAAGGYVEYDMNVTNSDTTPYGVDFIVYGNAFVGNPEAASVKVYGTPEGGTAGWYELAGSLYYADETLRNVDVTYKKVTAAGGEFNTPGIWYTVTRGSATICPWTKFNSNDAVAWWPETAEGYDRTWGNVEDVIWDQVNDEITYQNITLVRDTDTTPDYAFGYADITPNGSAYGTPANPYVYGTTGGNAFDISWAVDANGMPVHLTSISKVRVYTSAALDIKSPNNPIFTVPAIFGETSAEVCGIYAVTGSSTGSYASELTLSIGEEAFSLEDFESMGGRVWLLEYGLEEGVNLSVSAASGATVLINGEAVTTYTVTDEMVPVQIIVQVGDTAPIIAVVK
nr:hypothetical protein [uncultured Flavonifractor sp.]